MHLFFLDKTINPPSIGEIYWLALKSIKCMLIMRLTGLNHYAHTQQVLNAVVAESTSNTTKTSVKLILSARPEVANLDQL
jgi:hypothetical protein